MTERQFRKPTRDNEAGPQPDIQPSEVPSLSNTELASYLEASDYDYDGLSGTARIALVRLLRSTPFVDPFQHQKS